MVVGSVYVFFSFSLSCDFLFSGVVDAGDVCSCIYASNGMPSVICDHSARCMQAGGWCVVRLLMRVLLFVFFGEGNDSRSTLFGLLYFEHRNCGGIASVRSFLRGAVARNWDDMSGALPE